MAELLIARRFLPTVSFGQYSRPVSFTSTSERNDFDSLSEAISGVFGDVIPQSSRQSNVYILKIESPDWGGHLERVTLYLISLSSMYFREKKLLRG